MLSRQQQPKKAPRQRLSNAARLNNIRHGSLPSARSASVNILRNKLRDNEIYQFDLQIIPLQFVLTAGINRTRAQFATGAVMILPTLMACFEEIRFLGVRLTPRFISTASGGTGYFKMWLDDAILSTATTTFTDAFSRQTVDVNITSYPVIDVTKKELQWVATDDEDLDWISIPTGSPTTFVPFTIACFAAPGTTPNTNAGTGTAAADNSSQLMLDGAVRVQLRTLRTA